MADGLCTGEQQQQPKTTAPTPGAATAAVFYSAASDNSVYGNLCGRRLVVTMPAAAAEAEQLNASMSIDSSAGSVCAKKKKIIPGECTAAMTPTNLDKSAAADYASKGVRINNNSIVVTKKSIGASGGGGGGVDAVANCKRAKLDEDGSDVDITLNLNMPASPADDDCRKKRCVDRYDSSESSDSGVAILSCTDCSGSSTASSDITDPGSPFSTASTHSEDSGNSNQPTKMPPTQNVHHPPWPWISEDGPPKTMKTTRQAAKHKEISSNSTQKCLNNNNQTTSNRSAQSMPAANNNEPSLKKKPAVNCNNNVTANNVTIVSSKQVSTNMTIDGDLLDASKTFPRLQQGKITEYFKAQYKSSTILKKELSNIMIKTIANPNSKFSTKKLAEISVQPKRPIPRLSRGHANNGDKSAQMQQVKTARTVPRKILPAPSKQPDNIISMGQITTNNFPPIITTTLIPNVYAIQQAPQTKPTTLSTKPTDSAGTTTGSIYVPQFALNGAAPLGIIQPLQKVATINNFVKLTNATPSMMPAILKLNNFHTHPPHNNIINTAVPTVTVSAASLGKPVNNSSNKPRAVASQVCNVLLQAQHTNTTTTTTTTTKQCEQRLQANDEERKPMEIDVVEETRTQCPEELSPADSGVSSNLEVHINDDELHKIKALKSPILSQPKTIRFPAKERIQTPPKKLPVSVDAAACQWDQCDAQFDTNGALLEHLQVKHVISQASQEQYVCLWQGCKVHGRKSCSRSWLERHVLAHAGSKPFRCIVDGCGQRFNSQVALERHVNGHFNTDSAQSSNAKKSVENASVKLYKRNGKKIRFRRQPWSARMFDFIDSGMMEGLQYRLLKMTETRTNGQFAGTDGETVTLNSKIIGTRTELDGTRKLLLRWHPNDIVEDEWVTEKEYTKMKTVQIPRLQASAKNNLRPILFPRSMNYNSTNNKTASSICSGRQKHRRKPLRTTST